MLAEPPCSPWRVADDERAPSTPGITELLYEGTSLALDVPLYRMLAPHGYGPEQIDEWEAWQVAEVIEGILDDLHLRKPRRKGQRARPRTTRVTGPAPVRSGRDLVAQRIAHAEGRGPRPEPSAPGRDIAPLIAIASNPERAAPADNDDE